MLFNTPLNINKASFLVLLLVSTPTLHAKNPVPPDEVAKHIENPILSGKGRLSFLFFHIYDAALWVERMPWNFEQKFSLTIDYNRGLSKEKIVSSSIEEMQRYYSINDQKKLYRKILENIFLDVTSGDRISALYTPQKGLEFFHNGLSIGRIEEPTFAQRYINIWLHPNAHYGSLRKSLLGI